MQRSILHSICFVGSMIIYLDYWWSFNEKKWCKIEVLVSLWWKKRIIHMLFQVMLYCTYCIRRNKLNCWIKIKKSVHKKLGVEIGVLSQVAIVIKQIYSSESIRLRTVLACWIRKSHHYLKTEIGRVEELEILIKTWF